MTDYDTVTIPDTDTPPPASEDPTCLECGVPLIYGGRGRKPKWCDEHKPRRTSGTSGGRKSGDVAQAQAVLDGLYRGLTMGLMAISPVAAAQWNAKIDDLQATNAVLLAGDKDLTRTICKMGQGGGKLAFAAAHVMAVAPVVVTVRADLAVRAADRKAKHARPSAPGDPVDAGQSTDTGRGSFPNAGFFA